jgi:hypothetical protein
MLSLVSPTNLAIFALIGGVSALYQWATASEEAETKIKTLADIQEEAAEALAVWKEASEAAGTSLSSLTENYGQFADEVSRANDVLLESARLQAEAALTAEIDKALEGAYGFQEAIAATSDAMTGFITEGSEGFDYLSSRFGLFGEEAERVRVLMVELNDAEGFYNQAAAADALNAALLEIYGSYGAMPAAAQAVADATAEITKRAAEAGVELDALPAILAAAEVAANAAAAAVGGIGAAANNAYNAVASLVGKMREMAGGVQKVKNQGLASQYASYGAGRVAGEQLFREAGSLYGGDGRIDIEGKGGGGGGGRAAATSEAEKQAQAIDKVVASLRGEVEQIGMTAEARRLHQELQKAGVSIYSEEGQQIAALVEQLIELEAKQKLVAETMRGIENAAQGFFVGVLSGAKDLKSAIGDLLRELGNLLLNQAFKMLWGGASAGGAGGGIGSWLAGLFDAGGHIPSGATGIVAEKRPEFVDGKLVTSPTLVKGPANVTGGAATGRLLGRAPEMQVAMKRQTQPSASLAPRVTVQPAQVVVLDDPRKIDAWQRSPAGERTAAWQKRRMNNG